MKAHRITPEFRDCLLAHLDNYLADLENERIRGIESISPLAHQQFDELVAKQIQEVVSDIETLKGLE